ncbi:MAG: transcription antitermination factor NusB [Gemmatimonadaceae bacterium]
MPRLRAETRARARALQALYAWDVRGGEPLDRVASQVWDDLAIAPDERVFASRIVRVIMSDGAEIDSALRDVTTNWRLERLGAVERAVLRIAAAELRRGDPPARVTIQEAVRLAERYGSGQSARFVNGVLDALARKMGRL